MELGSCSLTYNINGKHLKLALDMYTPKIPRNHRRFLQPYIKKKLKSDLSVEVYDTHDNNIQEITDEELLEVWEELYRDGLVWEDAKKENLVRLTKENKSPEFIRQRDDTIHGFLEHTKKLGSLKEGEVAICDLDYIYSKCDPLYINGRYPKGNFPPKIEALKEQIDKENEKAAR